VLGEKEFSDLYDALRPQVFAYAVSRCGRQLAEEVVSETFTVAWRRRSDVPRRAVLPWLLGVARNVIRELYREEVRHAALAEALRGWAAEAAVAGGDVGEEVAQRAALLWALTALSDDDKEVLTLVSWHGLSSREAASGGRVLGVGLLRPAAPREKAAGGGVERGEQNGPALGTEGGRVRHGDLMRALAKARPDALDPVPGARPADEQARQAAEANRQPAGKTRWAGEETRRAGEETRWAGVNQGGRKGRRMGWLTAAVATAAVIGTVTVPRVLMTAEAPVAIAPGVLERAAQAAAARTAVPKKYWLVVTRGIGKSETGPKNGRYRVETARKYESWTPRAPGEQSLDMIRELYTRPASPKAEAAWRQAGSPRLCGNGTDCDGKTYPYSSNRTRYEYLTRQWPLDLRGIGTDKLLGLPQEPAALKRRLQSYWTEYESWRKKGPKPPKGIVFPTQDKWLFWQYVGLLAEHPITGGTRAALLRLVQSAPGVRPLGQITDSTGQRGVGIEYDHAWYLFSEADGRLLSQQQIDTATGDSISIAVYDRAEWVDSMPQRPENCAKTCLR
jgi:DNA-directed RNA polymerase specialized sigma24 family protein